MDKANRYVKNPPAFKESFADKATPRPWQVKNYNFGTYIEDKNGKSVTNISWVAPEHEESKQANAELIVKAVNRDHLFDELVKGVQEIEMHLTYKDYEKAHKISENLLQKAKATI